MATWYGYRINGLLISIFSAVIWLIVDYKTNLTYSHIIIPFWNALVRLVFFIIITFLLSYFKKSLYEREQAVSSDFLTGVSNTKDFYKNAEIGIARAKRYTHHLAAAYIDLDNFKYVNNYFGRLTGDKLLKATANILSENLLITDTVARIGKDEFIILFNDVSEEQGKKLALDIQKNLMDKMKKNKWPVTFSIGFIYFNQIPDTADEIIKLSCDLMNQVKQNGKDDIFFKVF